MTNLTPPKYTGLEWRVRTFGATFLMPVAPVANWLAEPNKRLLQIPLVFILTVIAFLLMPVMFFTAVVGNPSWLNAILHPVDDFVKSIGRVFGE